MDKKTKKKLEVLRKKLSLAEQQLAGVKKQTDEPEELTRLEAEVASIREQIQKLKAT